MDTILEKKIVSMFSDGNKSNAYSLGKIILLNRKNVIAELLKEGLSLRMIYYVLKQEHNLPAFVSLRYFYVFIKKYKNQILDSSIQNKDKNFSVQMGMNNQEKIENKKTFFQSRDFSRISLNKNNGQEVSVNVTTELYNFIHIPNKLYFFSKNDSRYPKYFPEKYKSDRVVGLIPWQNSAADLLISDENELYIPEHQLPLLDNLCLTSTGGGIITDFESRPVANLKSYAAYLANLFNHSFSKKPLHGRKI